MPTSQKLFVAIVISLTSGLVFGRIWGYLKAQEGQALLTARIVELERATGVGANRCSAPIVKDELMVTGGQLEVQAEKGLREELPVRPRPCRVNGYFSDAREAILAADDWETVRASQPMRTRQSFEAEPYDPYWAPTEEARLTTLLFARKPLHASELVSVECRSTACRIILEEPDGPDLRSKRAALWQSMLDYQYPEEWNAIAADYITDDTADGGFRVAIYLAMDRGD